MAKTVLILKSIIAALWAGLLLEEHPAVNHGKTSDEQASSS
jgi:hypothetical protein